MKLGVSALAKEVVAKLLEKLFAHSGVVEYSTTGAPLYRLSMRQGWWLWRGCPCSTSGTDESLARWVDGKTHGFPIHSPSVVTLWRMKENLLRLRIPC
jgi:hypothetical protein